MDNVKVRKAKKSDFEKVLDLEKQLWDTEKVFFDNINDEYYLNEETEKEVLRNILSRKNIVLVAENEHGVIGVIQGYIIKNKYAYKRKIAFIDKLVVDKNYRKNGIGKLLINEYSSFVKNKDCHFLKLNAFEQNIPAIKCYKNLGFEEYSIMYIKEI